MKKIWFDITNTPQVHFLCSIQRALQKINYTQSYFFSARDFSETVLLLKKQIGGDFLVIGGHHGKNLFRKSWGVISRFTSVFTSKIPYDISISNGSEAAIWTSWLKGRRSIAFGDNDRAKQWTYSRFVDFTFFPAAIPASILARQGIGKSKLFQYEGFKEDIYLADFKPDENFVKMLPFDQYIVVRPENLQANYLSSSGTKSITPELLKILSAKGYNILYLPRYGFDRDYANGLKNIYIPAEAINGLDACYYADAVLTGAGTFAREAACLGIPSVSFYSGNTLLAVDREMIKRNWMFFSRDPQEIADRVPKIKRREVGLERSMQVRDEVIQKLIQIMDSF